MYMAGATTSYLGILIGNRQFSCSPDEKVAAVALARLTRMLLDILRELVGI